MLQCAIKTLITAVVVVAVSELGKPSSLRGAVQASLPLTSLLAFGGSDIAVAWYLLASVGITTAVSHLAGVAQKRCVVLTGVRCVMCCNGGAILRPFLGAAVVRRSVVGLAPNISVKRTAVTLPGPSVAYPDVRPCTYFQEFRVSNSVNPVQSCGSIEQVRSNIDRIDQQIVALLAERGAYVKQAAAFKSSTADVRAPQRVEQVIGKVVALAHSLGANATVTEQVYRAMISSFIDAELAEHAALQAAAGKV